MYQKFFGVNSFAGGEQNYLEIFCEPLEEVMQMWSYSDKNLQICYLCLMMCRLLCFFSIVIGIISEPGKFDLGIRLRKSSMHLVTR
jgi:hypothetical protein